MKKLLHERLRDFISESWGCPIKNFSISDSYTPFIELTQNDAEQLADEIERYYIPRPRFEDGEPVQFGTEIEWSDFNQRIITGFGETQDGKPYITCAFDERGMCDAWVYDKYIKRPSPKVLDADGVEIKVGDTVWHVKGSNPWVVKSINKGDVLVTDRSRPSKNGGYVFLPIDLTHKEPDSLERLRYEMLSVYDRDSIVGTVTVKEWADRLSALIERGE